MAEQSEISWTDATFNPWEGCTKISPACANCYAEARANHYQTVKWGPEAAGGTRRVTSEKYWYEPHRWNRQAVTNWNLWKEHAQGGSPPPARMRVFCASLADVFEDWKGRMLTTKGTPFWCVQGSWSNSELPLVYENFDTQAGRIRAAEENARLLTMNDFRERLFDLIEETPNLDWLLLTKRPENVLKMVPLPWIDHGFPANVWMGATAERQEEYDKRLPFLEEIPAKVRFLSCEPLLGPIDLGIRPSGAGLKVPAIDWLISGGESGDKARPVHPDWIRSLRDQCELAKIAYHFKQWGEWCPSDRTDEQRRQLPSVESQHIPGLMVPAKVQFKVVKPDGGNRLFQANGTFSGEGPAQEDAWMLRLGKKVAGRELDGRTWDEFPRVALPMVKGGA